MGWELRRFFASRLFWLQALGFILLTVFVVWILREPYGFPIDDRDVTYSGFVAGTSVWGLLMTIPPIYITLLFFLLPFVNAEGVARDLTRRTHELLMTASLPTWAYVWGRYLIGLLMSLGLAALMLAAILGMGVLLHLTIPDYPLPPVGSILLLWVGMVLPATFLVSSLSFMLGSLFPRQANLVKIAILVGWIIGALVLPSSGAGQTKLPSWAINWDPTSAATGHDLSMSYQTAFNQQTSAPLSLAQWQQLLLSVENKAPDLSGWFGPHLLIAALSLLLVVVAAFAFQRFRNTLSA
jgi:ABC-type transport system involved in multi-copper enzyme maturation permease subunit